MKKKNNKKDTISLDGAVIKINKESAGVIQNMFVEVIYVAKAAVDKLEDKLKGDRKKYELFKPWLSSIRGIIENTPLDFSANQSYELMSHSYNLCTLVSSFFNAVWDAKGSDNETYNKVTELLNGVIKKEKEINDAMTDEYIKELSNRAKGCVTIFEEDNEPEEKSFIIESVNLFDTYVKKAKKARPIVASFYESGDHSVVNPYNPAEECDTYGIAIHLRQKVNCELLDGCACFVDEDEVNGKLYTNKFLIQNHIAVPKSLKSNKRNIKKYLKTAFIDWTCELINGSLGNCVHSIATEKLIENAIQVALTPFSEYVADTRKMK